MSKWISLLLAIMLLTSCQFIQKEESDAYLDRSKESKRIYYQDLKAEALFQKVYFINHLLKQNLFVVDDELHLELYFDHEVDRLSIQNTRNYFTQIALIKDLIYTEVPYWYEDIISHDFEKYQMRIFVDDELYLYEEFDQKEHTQDYYEDHDMALPFKVYTKEAFSEYRTSIMEEVPDIQSVRGVKPIKDSILILEVESIEELKEEQIESIKDSLVTTLAPVYDNEDYWPYAPNTGYIGLVLQFYAQENRYQEYVYFNTDDKRWMDIEWQHFDFFRESLIQ